jgi:hypothetical protein
MAGQPGLFTAAEAVWMVPFLAPQAVEIKDALVCAIPIVEWQKST